MRIHSVLCAALLVQFAWSVRAGEATVKPGAEVALPSGCWSAVRAEALEKSLDAFFAEKDAAKRAERFTSELAPQQPGLTLEELEEMGRAAPPPGARKGDAAWRVQAPWAKENTQAWFNLALPKGYTPAKSWRLVVVLHGGPAVHDGDHLLRNFTPTVNDAGCFSIYPTIFDNKAGWGDAEEMAWVYRLVEWTVRHYRIDCRQLVIAGGYAGGLGVWSHLARFPEVWSAGAAASAFAPFSEKEFLRLKDIPLFLVNGEKDQLLSRMRSTVDELKKIGAKVQFREVANAEAHLTPESWQELAGWVAKQEVKPYSPRPIILLPANGQTLWQRAADPLGVNDDADLALLKAGRFAEAKKELDARILKKPGQAKDYMLRAIAELPALNEPLPAGLDVKELKDGQKGWGPGNEADGLRDLETALRSREGKGEDVVRFDSRCRLLFAKIWAKRFVMALGTGGLGWVTPFNNAMTSLKSTLEADPSNAEAVQLVRALSARMPRPGEPSKK